MGVTPLLEQALKRYQNQSDMDLLLSKFKNVVVMKSEEQIEKGLTIYNMIPKDTCYLFPFLT